MDLFPLAPHHVICFPLQLAGHPELCAADLAGSGLSALAQLDAHRFEARSPAAKTSGSNALNPCKKIAFNWKVTIQSLYTHYIFVYLLLLLLLLLLLNIYIYIYTSLYIIKAYTT